MDEINLILQTKNGDQDAFCTLVKKYQTQALRTAYLICNNKYTSEDMRILCRRLLCNVI